MSLTVKQIIDGVIEREKGYVNHPSDLGGPTRWGVTEKVARENGYKGDMRDLPRTFAYDILLREYYVKPGFNDVGKVSTDVSVVLTDAGVLCGQQRVSSWFQMVLNALNRRQKFYPDLAVDGSIGPRTIAAFKAYMDARGHEGEVVMLRAMNAMIGHHFIDISLKREANEDFTYGWLLHRTWVI